MFFLIPIKAPLTLFLTKKHSEINPNVLHQQ